NPIPSRPCSVATSTNSRTVSVNGFWCPVSTFASLTGVSSGSTTCESVRWRMRSDIGLPTAYDKLSTHHTSLFTGLTAAPEREAVGAMPTTIDDATQWLLTKGLHIVLVVLFAVVTTRLMG